MRTDWLVERCESLDPLDIALHEVAELDLSDANKRKLVQNSEARRKWAADKWAPFIAELTPDDEVWRFRSPPETWANFCGCSGYSVVRDGEILRSLTTMRN